MSNFVDILQKAIDGDNDAMDDILWLYLPLINRNSIIDGVFDEDCRQYIMLRIVNQIRKFKIGKIN